MDDVKTMTLAVEGMSCNHCVSAIKDKLSAMPGVHNVDISLEKGEVVVTAAEVSPQFLVREIDALGYTASVKQ